jgi:very-short-patch-repair endonuclease
VGARCGKSARRVLTGGRPERAVPTGTTVDFFAPEPRLVVEVDGTSHVGREWRDRERDAYLARYGVQVLRVKAWHVERALPVVLVRIRAALG